MTFEEKLNEMAALQEGWNSYKAKAISPEIIALVKKFLTEPAIVPLSDGGILLEWQIGPQVLTLEFSGDHGFHIHLESATWK